MKLKYVILAIYLIAVSVFLLLTQGNLTVVGIFLLFFNSMAAPGIFAGIAAKQYGIKPDEEGKKLSDWYSNASSMITLLILFGSYSQITEYLGPSEIAVLFAVYFISVVALRYLVNFLFNHYLGKFNSENN